MILIQWSHGDPEMLTVDRIFNSDLTGKETNTSWYAVVMDKQEARIQEVKIKIFPSRDDEGNDISSISSVPNAIFHLRGTPMKEGKIKAFYGDQSMHIGSSISYGGGGDHLFVSGEYTASKDHKSYSSKNVKLLYKNKNKTYTVVDFNKLDIESYMLVHPHLRIFWVGDVNSDGLLDFMLTVDEKWSHKEMHLSKKNKNGTIQYIRIKAQPVVGC